MKKLPLLLSFSLFICFSSTALAESFSDVPTGHLNAQAIQALKDEGILVGYSNGKYRPNDRSQRDEFVKMIVETIATDEEIAKCNNDLPYSDVDREDWSYHHICWATQNKLVNGYPDGTFKLADKVSFVEGAKIINNALKLVGANENQAEWYKDYVQALEDRKAIPSTVHSFDANLTRGEIPEILYRLKGSITTKPSASYATLSADLPLVASCPDLKEKFQVYSSYYNYQEPSSISYPVAMMAETGGGMGGGVMEEDYVTTSSSFSTTNLQVQGVDEADIVKNDGKYIYWSKTGDKSIRVMNAYPGPEMSEAAKIEFESGFTPKEMFLAQNSLVVLGSFVPASATAPVEIQTVRPTNAYKGSQSRVYVLDVSDPAHPKELRRISYQGNYKTARVIGNQLYLVMTTQASAWKWGEVKEGVELIPTVKDGNNEAKAMADCSQIRFFPGYYQPEYMMVSGLDFTKDNSAIDTELVLGNAQNVYSSPTDLFVASAAHAYSRYSDRQEGFKEVRTNVFRFGLSDGKVDFEKRGVVPGTILNQFSMDQQGSNFRIATTTGSLLATKTPSMNHVFVLDENMKVMGKLNDIAPGEKIYSTRFVGDRLYMVTFKKVDPFFVIDLKDPSAPKILGSLKIPGYSDYLHPYDENHVIGFGKSTEEATEEEKAARGLDFAWFQGMKMSLFDVSDVAHPKQKFAEGIGDRGTTSTLLSNHKALLFDKEKNLIAFPIQLVKEGEPTFDGAVVYTLTLDNGFKERGRITHTLTESASTSNTRVQRVVRLGEYLYGLSQSFVSAADLETVKELKKVELTTVTEPTL